MGVQLSKMRTGESPPILPLPASLQYTSELSSYEDACEQDPDLQTFDTTLRDRTSRVISSLAGGVEVRSLSIDSLKEVTGCLLEMNQEVVKIILDCKKDIWRNQDLFELVEEYFENSLQTLDFCTVLEKCLKQARDSQLILLVALQQFDEEGSRDAAGGDEKRRHRRTLEELSNFKAAGDPFTDEFVHVFQSVYKQQLVMLEKLQHRRSKIDKRIRSIKAWRKVSCIIFASAFAAVLICSVVAAAMAAPPVAAALAVATSIPLGSMGKWFDSLWKRYEVALKGQKEVLNSIHVGTFVVIKDLDGIRVLVDRMEIEIKSLGEKAAFGVENEEALRFVIAEIRKTLGVFMKSIEDLGELADSCSRDIRRARTVVLQRIIKHPNQN